MRVKRYVVNSISDALSRIRSDLGEKAVILDSRPVRGTGIFGLFGKRRFEVIAAVDATPQTANANPNSNPNPDPPAHSSTSVSLDAQLQADVRSLKQMMEGWVNEQRKNEMPDNFAPVERLLREQHVAEDVIYSVQQAVAKQIDDIRHVDEKIVTALTAEEIKRRFEKKIAPDTLASGEQEVVYFIGPTGMGKTTTIAKIAAIHVLEKGRRVGLIAADTYRIAAVEQLKTYANILNVPLEIVRDQQEMEESKRKLADCDVILVDTAGRNYRQKMNVSELFAFIQDENATVHLVLSLTMRDDDIRAVLNNFSAWPISRLLLTKADETTSFGLPLNLACQTDYPFSFITTGQSVPDDIIPADAATLTDWVMGGIKDV